MSDVEKPAHDVTVPSSSVADRDNARVSTSLPAEAVTTPGTPLDLDALSELCEYEVPEAFREAFIAAARTAMPALIERVRNAEKDRDDFAARGRALEHITLAARAEASVSSASARDARRRAEAAEREVAIARGMVIREQDRAESFMRERDELRAAVERVPGVIEQVANDALLYGWADGQGRVDEPILFTRWAKERAEKEARALDPQPEAER